MGVSIDTGGKGGKRPLDAELNLVPFIDLLVCCICFLLITAVWSQMARIKATQTGPSSSITDPDKVPPELEVNLSIRVGEAGYMLVAGEEKVEIPKTGEEYDRKTLREELKRLKSEYSDKEDISVELENSIPYLNMIETMDVAIQEDFPDIKIKDAPPEA